MSKPCPKCGSANTASSKYCAECGAALIQATNLRGDPIEVARDLRGHPIEQETAKRSRWVIGLIVAVAVCATAYIEAPTVFGGAFGAKHPLKDNLSYVPANERTSTTFNDDIELIRGGVLPEYPNATIGTAFESTFENVRWRSYLSPKGAHKVIMHGTLTKSFRESYFSNFFQHEQDGDDAFFYYKADAIACLGLDEWLRLFPEALGTVPYTKEEMHQAIQTMKREVIQNCLPPGSTIDVIWGLDLRQRITIDSVSFSVPPNAGASVVGLLRVVYN